MLIVSNASNQKFEVMERPFFRCTTLVYNRLNREECRWQMTMYSCFTLGPRLTSAVPIFRASGKQKHGRKLDEKRHKQRIESSRWFLFVFL